MGSVGGATKRQSTTADAPRSAVAEEAVRRESVKCNRLGYLSQEDPFATHKAVMAKVTMECNAEEKVAQGSPSKEKATAEDVSKQRYPLTKAAEHQPVAVTSLKQEDIESSDIPKGATRQSQPASLSIISPQPTRHTAAKATATIEHLAEKELSNKKATKNAAIKYSFLPTGAALYRPASVTDVEDEITIDQNTQNGPPKEPKAATTNPKTPQLVEQTQLSPYSAKEKGKGRASAVEDESQNTTGDTAAHYKITEEQAMVEEHTTDHVDARIKVTCLCPWRCRKHPGTERRFESLVF